MSHYRTPLTAAVVLNSGIFAVEAAAGYLAGSLSLIMDGIHNFSDELALLFLYLAFVLSQGISRHLLRAANIFNSVGLIVVSALLLWQALERLFHPTAIQGTHSDSRRHFCRSRELGRCAAASKTEPEQCRYSTGIRAQHW